MYVKRRAKGGGGVKGGGNSFDLKIIFFAFEKILQNKKKIL